MAGISHGVGISGLERTLTLTPSLAPRRSWRSHQVLDYNEYSAHPTATGRKWGLTHWFRGDYPIDTTAVSHALAVDESGQATDWVQVYRPDRPGSGYVQLWGFGATVERLPFIRAVAEYGLLRAAAP